MPTIQQVHKNAALSNISIAYSNPMYRGDEISPRVKVQKESDIYYVFDKSNLRVDESVKSEKGEANKVDYSVTTATYNVVVHALESIVTPRLIENSDGALAPMQDTTEMLTDKLMLEREKAVLDVVLSSANFAAGNKSTTGIPILNGSSGDVVAMIASGHGVVAKKIGRRPNTIVMDATTFIGLKSNTTILDRTKYTSSAAITEDILARLFEVEKVIVSWAIRDTAKQGQTATLNYVAGEGLALIYTERSPGLRKPTFTYTFYTKDRMVETRNADNIETGAKWVRVIDSWQVKSIDTSAGYLLLNTVQ